MAFGVKVQRIKKIVIHPPIQHIDGLVSARRTHGDAAIHNLQIMPFDQFNTHLIGQKRMFEIRGVVDTRREHRDGRLALCHFGRTCRKRTAQVRRIALNALHFVLGKQLREHLQHGFPVFEHVAHTRWCPCIVFKNKELTGACAHKVDADDMRVDPTGHIHAKHLGQKCLVLGNHLAWDAPRLQDFLCMVDVVQKRIDRAHTLLDPARQLCPFRPGDDPGNDIKRDQPFFGFGPSINVERDARQTKKLFRLAVLGP